VITILSPQAKEYLHLETFTTAFGAIDGVSGVAHYNATLDGSPVDNLRPIDLFNYAPGNHTFEVTAENNAGLTSTRIVTFHVLASQTLKNDSIPLLQGINTTDKHARKEIDRAIEHIEKSFGLKKKLKHEDEEDDDDSDDSNDKTKPLWLGSHRIDPKHGHMVFNDEKKAVGHLLKACEQKDEDDDDEDEEEDDEKHGEKNDEDEGKDKDKGSKDDHDDDDSEDKDEPIFTCTFNTTVIRVINNLLLADGLLANTSIRDAGAALANASKPKKVQKEIDKAYEELEKAYSEIAEEDYPSAIDKFKAAWEHAQLAIKHSSEKEDDEDDDKEEEKESHKEKHDEEKNKGDEKDRKKEGKGK
jgi:hypothetical protein